jgi:transposase-like protein
VKLRGWPKEFVCPKCRGKEAGQMSNGRFLCRACRRQTSVTAGTGFASSHRPLQDWFRAVWLLTDQGPGTNAVTLQRALGIGSYHTAWEWLHTVRQAMRLSHDPLSGTVSVDEAYLDSGKRHGKQAGQTLIMVAAETVGAVATKIRFQVLPDATATALRLFAAKGGKVKTDSAFLDALKLLVAMGSDMHTDALPHYSGLPLGHCRHRVVASTIAVGKEVLPPLLPVVAEVKEWLRDTYREGVHNDSLQSYLDEFAFRFNNRNVLSHRRRFDQLLKQILWTHHSIGSQLK